MEFIYKLKQTNKNFAIKIHIENNSLISSKTEADNALEIILKHSAKSYNWQYLGKV